MVFAGVLFYHMEGWRAMHAIIKQTLQDLKGRQCRGEHMLCPRCGRDTMHEDVRTNSLSYHAGIRVCDDCITNEVELVHMNNPRPLAQWACVRSKRPSSDLKTLPGATVIERLWVEQVPYLVQLYECWLREPNGTNFEGYWLEAYRDCPGLSGLWSEPFRAAYDVADGSVSIRFRVNENRVEVAIDFIPKFKHSKRKPRAQT